MTQVDTSQRLTIFPRAIGWKMLLGCAAIVAGSLAIVPFAWVDQAWPIVWLSAGFGTFMLVLLVLLIRKRARGTPDPALMLTPEGLHFLTGTVGVVPWRDVRSLGSFAVKGNQALVINVEKAAIARLDQGKFFKTSRKLDAAIGIHGLTFFQQQLELPIPEVARLLHQYSLAHGGPALQPDP
ncbi:STM3941 family protein [Jannaschia sp. CCS1]|uniref:STM3941 family protein n=1 Tax=Jannaschia sp. (strain CCS1) TaxID=290400 RepID=UPI000053CBF5|nr:STM3941 family protein [Jannaschia sp. CCS1]ABD53743.1 hypothetical protein Jann_0826 [Jannaschia sp. CCS1]